MKTLAVLLLIWLLASLVAGAQLVPVPFEYYQQLNLMVDSSGLSGLLSKAYDDLTGVNSRNGRNRTLRTARKLGTLGFVEGFERSEHAMDSKLLNNLGNVRNVNDW